MEYVIRHNYGSRSFTSKIKRDDRFKKKITVYDGGSDPRINKKRRSGGNKGNLFAKIQRTLAVGFCLTVMTASVYMSAAISKQNSTPKTEAAPQQQDEDPNSTRDTFPREYTSADMPRGYVEPEVVEDNAFAELIDNESGSEEGRINKESLACGIGQFYPCTKLYSYATRDWIIKNKVVRDGKWYLPNPDRSYEIGRTKEYIRDRYGNAINALAEWKKLKPCGLNKKKLCNWY